jgi:hypothetical protein
MESVELRIEFETGNAATLEPGNWAALIACAAGWAAEIAETGEPGEHRRPIRDTNGNTVGRAVLTLPELEDTDD